MRILSADPVLHAPDSSKSSLPWLQSGICFATGIGTLIHPCCDPDYFFLSSTAPDCSKYLFKISFFIIIERGIRHLLYLFSMFFYHLLILSRTLTSLMKILAANVNIAKCKIALYLECFRKHLDVDSR